jgi:hypothetical protein
MEIKLLVNGVTLNIQAVDNQISLSAEKDGTVFQEVSIPLEDTIDGADATEFEGQAQDGVDFTATSFEDQPQGQVDVQTDTQVDYLNDTEQIATQTDIQVQEPPVQSPPQAVQPQGQMTAQPQAQQGQIQGQFEGFNLPNFSEFVNASKKK